MPEATLGSEEAERLVREIAPQVEELRGLAFRAAVPVQVVDDAVMREHVLAELDAYDQRERLALTDEVYELLGLIAPGTDALGLLLDALEEQVGGFYDPASGRFFLLEDVPRTAAPIFAAHELTHALEDQHFDLDRQLREVLEDDDRLLAQSAVREGSATLLMAAYLARAMGRGELDAQALTAIAESEAGRAERLNALPPALQRELLAPYVLGGAFLARGGTPGGTAGFPAEAVNRAMRRGPSSTEQILHPEKYWDAARRDEPTPVKLRGVGKVLGSGFTRAGGGVLGELVLGCLVGACGAPGPAGLMLPDPAAWTNAAASGWDGDRYELWRGSRGSLVVLLTAWDSPPDAAEFAAACRAERDGFTVEARGARAAVVAGALDAETTRRLLARLLR